MFLLQAVNLQDFNFIKLAGILQLLYQLLGYEDIIYSDLVEEGAITPKFDKKGIKILSKSDIEGSTEYKNYVPIGDKSFIADWLSTYYDVKLPCIEIPEDLRKKRFLGKDRNYHIINKIDELKDLVGNLNFELYDKEDYFGVRYYGLCCDNDLDKLLSVMRCHDTVNLPSQYIIDTVKSHDAVYDLHMYDNRLSDIVFSHGNSSLKVNEKFIIDVVNEYMQSVNKGNSPATCVIRIGVTRGGENFLLGIELATIESIKRIDSYVILLRLIKSIEYLSGGKFKWDFGRFTSVTGIRKVGEND